jgi:hypothetical protein
VAFRTFRIEAIIFSGIAISFKICQTAELLFKRVGVGWEKYKSAVVGKPYCFVGWGWRVGKKRWGYTLRMWVAWVGI